MDELSLNASKLDVILRLNELIAAYNEDKPIMDSIKAPIDVETPRGKRRIV